MALNILPRKYLGSPEYIPFRRRGRAENPLGRWEAHSSLSLCCADRLRVKRFPLERFREIGEERSASF